MLHISQENPNKTNTLSAFRLCFCQKVLYYLSTHVDHLLLSVVRGVITTVLETMLAGDNIAYAFFMGDSENT